MTDLNNTNLVNWETSRFHFGGSLEDYGCDDTAQVSIHFRNLGQHLIKCIEQYPVVVGCVAWLTNREILSALSKKAVVSIAIQKEDFLRPDITKSGKQTETLRSAYSQLPTGCRYDFGEVVSDLSVCSDPDLEPVRCVGNYNYERKPASPRMHNKFLVFCDIKKEEPETYEPKKVWTGSFNFTYNSTMSLENAVVVDSDTIARAYYREWAQIIAISEPLDWESTWVEPEWRIGT